MQTAWEIFFSEKARDIFETSTAVYDFGGGLRIDKKRNNRLDPANLWLLPLAEKIDYKVIDVVADYNPDVVADIQTLPFADNVIDAYVCLAVLEHVPNPIKAMEEMYRTLKPGGKILVYVPFLFYYHAHPGYYKDYWRFTIDSLESMTEKFSERQVQEVKMPIETLLFLTPLGKSQFLTKVARFIDGRLYKQGSRQVSGYFMYLIK